MTALVLLDGSPLLLAVLGLAGAVSLGAAIGLCLIFVGPHRRSLVWPAIVGTGICCGAAAWLGTASAGDLRHAMDSGELWIALGFTFLFGWPGATIATWGVFRAIASRTVRPTLE